jgi:outer membrane murein-binding lipoprotein Lpp
MSAALLGFAGVVLAALFGLTGVLYTTRPAGHHADIEGLSALVDQLQEERDALRAALHECQAEAARLRGEHG